MNVTSSREYAAIRAFYGDRRARRSGVRLMDHIDQGLAVLTHIGASGAAHAAFCLHPLFQADAELTTVGLAAAREIAIHPYSVMLAMEYRRVANAWLADRVRRVGDDLLLDGLPKLGPLPEVRYMLVADKVQNRRDFERYHLGRHARSSELDLYFRTWLHCLGVSGLQYAELCSVMERMTGAG